MIGETYNYTKEDNIQYFFLSTGTKGNITKYVQFYEKQTGYFNLGFGDLSKDGVDDTVVSNNNDLIKVMNTIGAIIYEFLTDYPNAIIEIKPVDSKRSRLYHTIFSRRIKEINRIFVLEGLDLNKNWITFYPNNEYQAFRLKQI